MYRFLLFILITGLASCYDDYDFSTEIITEEKPRTLINSGLNGHFLDFNSYSSADISLELADNSFVIEDARFYKSLQRVSKISERIQIRHGHKTVAIANVSFLENDIQRVEFRAFPDYKELSLNAGTTREIEESYFDMHLSAETVSADGLSQTEDLDMRYSLIEDAQIINQLGQAGMDADGQLLVLENIQWALHIESFDRNAEISILNASKNWLTLNDISGDLELFRLAEDGLFRSVDTDANRIAIKGEGLYMLAEKRPAVYLEGAIKYNDTAISYLPLELGSHHFSTTAEGRWAGLVEQGVDSELRILDNCNDFIQSFALPARDDDFKQYEFQLGASDRLTLMRTSVIDCEGKLQMLPALQIDKTGIGQLFIFRNNPINNYLAVCENEFSLLAIDPVGMSRGPAIPWSREQEADLKYMSSCQNFENGFSFIRINGEEKLYSGFNSAFDGSETRLSSDDGLFRIKFDGQGNGFYTEQMVNLYINDTTFGDAGYGIDCEQSNLGCGIKELYVSHYSTDGDWLRLSFSGEIWAQTLDPPVAAYYPIEGVILTKNTQ